MDFSLTPGQIAFQRQVRQFLQREVTDELRAEVRQLNVPGPATAAFRNKLAECKWLGLSWPTKYGGAGRSHLEQYLLAEELEYAEAPPLPLAITSLGPTLMRVGIEEQKQQFLPGLLRGEIDLAMGYSEPNAGSDLASLEARAVLEGNQYVIHGHKVFTSIAHLASHIWLAARTNANAPKHKGISIFLVPVDIPGLTIRPVWTMGNGRVNEVFLDGVRVPRRALLGEQDRGWAYIVMALDFERGSLAPYSLLLRLLEHLVAHVKARRAPPASFNTGRVRSLLADFAVRTEIARLLALRTAWLIDQGKTPQYEAHVQKVFRSETLQAIVSEGINILGLHGQLEEGDAHAVLFGKFARLWQMSVRTTIGGGTNEVLRTAIASRGLGLPRQE